MKEEILFRTVFSDDYGDNTVIVIKLDDKYVVRVRDEIGRVIPDFDYIAESKLDAIETAKTWARDSGTLPKPKPEVKEVETFVWLNCHGVDVVGKGTDHQDAFSKLPKHKRDRIIWCDRCVKGEVKDGILFTNQETIRLRGIL